MTYDNQWLGRFRSQDFAPKRRVQYSSAFEDPSLAKERYREFFKLTQDVTKMDPDQLKTYRNFLEHELEKISDQEQKLRQSLSASLDTPHDGAWLREFKGRF